MNPTPRILIVEDDQDTALFLRHVLVKRGQFDVTHTLDPAVALALAATQEWDLVVTDLELPGMSGLGLTAALRALDRRLPVVIATACEKAAHDPAARGPACPDAILVKPLRVDQVLSIAAALIGRRRAGLRQPRVHPMPRG